MHAVEVHINRNAHPPLQTLRLDEGGSQSQVLESMQAVLMLPLPRRRMPL